MKNALGQEFVNRKNGCVELLLDWVTPFNHCFHSTGILGVRYMDVYDRDRSKSSMIKLLAIITGPRMPNNIRPYLLNTLKTLRAMHLDGHTVKVMERYGHHGAPL